MSEPANDKAPAQKTRAQKVRSVLIDIAIIFAIFFGMHLWRTRDLPDVGEPAPQLELLDLEGSAHNLESYRGRPVLVHFWATWCGVCRTEFGALNAVDDAAADDAVLLAVVEDGENLDQIRQFAASRGLDYTILRATPETMAEWNVSVFPTNVYIAPDGAVAQRTVGRAFGWGMRARLWWVGLTG